MQDSVIFRARSPQELYRRQLVYLLSRGDEVFVHGRPTRELLNAITIIEEPRRRVHCAPGRQANPWLALSECLWLLAGQNDVASLRHYNKNIVNYSDDGETLYGAYGYRLKDQIPAALERLAADPNDRRVVLTIWAPEDLEADSLDPPCNTLLTLKLRDGRLHMTVFNRSNDIHFGLYAVNLPQFSLLQEYMAARLGCGLGYQTHISNSLHVYTDSPSKEITERMLPSDWRTQRPIEMPVSEPLTLGRTTHAEFVQDCRQVLAGLEYGVYDDPAAGGVPFLEFASDYLRCYREDSDSRLSDCRHAAKYPDWVLAGQQWWAAKRGAVV